MNMNIDPNTSQAFELSNEELIEKAVSNNEAVLADNGALTAVTGERTGRSPNDRFIVKEPGTEDLIEWGAANNLLILISLMLCGTRLKAI